MKRMTREEARRITVKQFLSYMSETEVIQVCFKTDEWDNYVELTRNSILLKPFLGCRIDCMGAEFMDSRNDPIIRISIDDSNMVYLDS